MISSRPSVTSSLPCSFAPQGLFRPGQMHLYLAFLFHRDYFGRPNASLSGFSASQGLFCPGLMHLYLAFLLHRDYFGRPDLSLSCSFAPQGLLCPSLMHLYLALLLHRDYFGRPDSSLSCSFAPQGLFRPPGFISIWLFCSTRITLPKSDASLSGFSGIQMAYKFYFFRTFRHNSRHNKNRKP